MEDKGTSLHGQVPWLLITWWHISSHIIDLVSWWHHQMETFSVLLAICMGNSPVTGEFPTQRPVMRSFDVFLARADQGSVKAPCQYRLAMGSINEGSDFSMHSATKFKCNFVVIDVVHSGIKMTGSYFSEFRWDEKCCNSLHEYKDYSKTHPLPQYAQMINFIPITKCSPKWWCDACRTARTWRKRMAQRCPVNRQHRAFFYMGSLGF